MENLWRQSKEVLIKRDITPRGALTRCCSGQCRFLRGWFNPEKWGKHHEEALNWRPLMENYGGAFPQCFELNITLYIETMSGHRVRSENWTSSPIWDKAAGEWWWYRIAWGITNNLSGAEWDWMSFALTEFLPPVEDLGFIVDYRRDHRTAESANFRKQGPPWSLALINHRSILPDAQAICSRRFDEDKLEIWGQNATTLVYSILRNTWRSMSSFHRTLKRKRSGRNFELKESQILHDYVQSSYTWRCQWRTRETADT